MIRWLYIFRESLLSAYRTVTLNKLRTFLSLLGVTIGIISIVSIFTVLDSLEYNIRKEIDTFGNDVVVVEKWPWTFEEGETEYPWWEYMNRPVTTLQEYAEIKRRMPRLDNICFIAAISTRIEYLDRSADNVIVWGTSDGFETVRSFSIQSGRFFNAFEINSGKNLCIIGNAVAEELFSGLNPLGREIQIRGRKASIIGIFTKEGSSIFGGGSMDEVVLIPVSFLGTMADLKNENTGPQIWVKGPEGISINELKENLRFTMRAIRGIKPSAKDDFALNQTSLMSAGIDQIFKIIGLAGWVIGIFAVLVGGFGIANIMFVSVKERTPVIGIQKALGAKNHYIILEVLYESVLLSIVGGIFGLLFVYAGTYIARAQDFDVFLGWNNIVSGLFISTFIGLIAGLLPAVTASRLDPVKAIASPF
ncbi:MAG: ABC transporter permease [Bacteroidales bacterium]|nr:ABC transporter permease [Bacteroidales bacterium]